jgi:hypothetical protein
MIIFRGSAIHGADKDPENLRQWPQCHIRTWPSNTTNYSQPPIRLEATRPIPHKDTRLTAYYLGASFYHYHNCGVSRYEMIASSSLPYDNGGALGKIAVEQVGERLVKRGGLSC